MNPDNFVEWQKKCVCDFVNNNNTHSKTCLVRFKELEKRKVMEAKIYCPHCYKIIELEKDQENNLYVIEENDET